MSVNIVKRRIKKMADNIENQVIKIIKNSPFYSIQLNESTDVNNKALLLCFVRVECEGELQEELLCSLNLPDRPTSFEIFKALGTYFLEQQLNKKNCIGICTDGAANMTGHRAGVVAKVKNVSHPDIGPDGRCFLAAWALSKSVHCCLNDRPTTATTILW